MNSFVKVYNSIIREGKTNDEFRDRKGDYMDLYYNLKYYLYKLGRDLEEDYRYYSSTKGPHYSEAANVIKGIINTIYDYNEQAQGDGSREEFVELKGKVEGLLMSLHDDHEWAHYGPVTQEIVQGIIESLDEELETY